MKKYKINRKLITCKCDHCEIDFEKPESEYKRNIKLNRKNFCSRNCMGKTQITRLHSYPKIDISKYSNNRKDEFTPFKYYLKCSKQRFKEFSITLEDLKIQWEKQDGICPYSGIKLLLSTHKNITKDPIYSASLDRIDSNFGYITGNIQFVSISINYMKSTMTHDKTIELCKIIANNYKSL